MRWRSRLLLPLVSALLVIALLPGSAAAARCANVNTTYIKAKSVRTSSDLGCSLARQTLKRYFRKVVASGQVQGGCAHRRAHEGCRVRSFRCWSNYVDGRILGICTGPLGTVRFRELDFGPG